MFISSLAVVIFICDTLGFVRLSPPCLTRLIIYVSIQLMSETAFIPSQNASNLIQLEWRQFFENTVGKGESAGKQNFLLFPRVSTFSMDNFLFLNKFELSSVNAFCVRKCKILSPGLELIYVQRFRVVQWDGRETGSKASVARFSTGERPSLSLKNQNR